MKVGDRAIINNIVYRIIEIKNYNEIKLALSKNSIKNANELIQKLDNTDKCANKIIAEWFVKSKKITHGFIKSVRNTKIETAENVIRKLHDIDGYSYMEIVLTLSAAMKDDFWKDVVLTCSGLRRKRKGRQTWFEMIRAKIHNINADKDKSKDINKQQKSVMEELT